MSENRILKAAITQGDLNGVGSEIIIKSLVDQRMSEVITPVIYGSAKALSFYKRGVEGAENMGFNIISSPDDANPRRLNVINCAGDEVRIEPGQPSAESGAVAVAALKAAVEDLKAGKVDILITAPINKETAKSESFPYMGHTDFLGDSFGGKAMMVMCSEVMRIVPATVHIPLSQVAEVLTKELLVAKLTAMRKMLVADFEIVEPRIAVLALNPHAGDGGLVGKEEQDIIKPAILEASASGVLAFGPFAADGFFASGAFARYDAVLAMYHDQGLAPFKALTPAGVNYTAGLAVIRTSPDHGTGYDIAGKGVADPQSMRNAIYEAVDIYRSRERYKVFSANPLRRFEREKGRDMSVNDLPDVEN